MMKIGKHLSLALLALLMLCGFSMDVSYYEGYSSTPILMERSDFESAIATLPAKELSKTTRISLLGSRIFIVEQFKGVHVIDNADPRNPKVDYFINIPGCMDMAIKDDVMYARSAEDLVAINISDLSQVQEINRVKETFPELYLYEDYYSVPYRFQKGQRPENTVIVAWESK